MRAPAPAPSLGARLDRELEARRPLLFGLGVLLLLVYPWIAPTDYWVRVACWVGLYGLLASGLNVVVGLAGLLDLGYVAFYGIGSYTFAMLASDQFGIHWSFWVIIVIAIAATATAGILLGIPVLPLRGDYLAIVTLGFGEMVYILLINLDRPVNITNGTNGIVGIDQPTLFGFDFDQDWKYYYLILVLLVLGVGVIARLNRSRLGRAWIALREDEVAAAANGINTTTTKLWAFAIGASFAGAVGSVSAALQGSVFPDSFLFTESTLILSMVVLGGMGNLAGAIVGAAVLVVVPELLRSFQEYRLLIFGAVLMLMMIFRPAGLIVSRRRQRELTPADADVEAQEWDTLYDVEHETATEPGDGDPMSALLEARDLTMRFGGLVAVNAVSLQVQQGQIWAVIGPNGAGKTTLFNMLTGMYQPTSGDVLFDGRSIRGEQPNRIVARGIARTFQNIRLFANMTALENVLVGQHARLRSAPWSAVLATRGERREEEQARTRALELLDFVGLRGAEEYVARQLPYGHQRRLEIARALAADPRLLLLDEPAAGANPAESAQLLQLIRRIRDRGVSILLIEHDMKVVMNVSDAVTVLDHGEKIAEGPPDAVRRDPRVVEAYLGAESAERKPPARTAANLSKSANGTVALELAGVEAGYGGIRALKGVSLRVNEGEIVTLIGSNGAGKTTTLKTICGLVKARAGEVRLYGDRIDGLDPHKIVRRGVCVSPEGRGVFRRMTVLENLQMGAYERRDQAGVRADLERVFELFPRLKERETQLGGTLSGGEQQMLAIGRALMAQPKVLLLDEPSLGLAPLLVETIFGIVQAINGQGTTILLVEQNAQRALEIAHRGYVLQSGSIVLTDTAQRLLESPDVQAAYLGGAVGLDGANGAAGGTPGPG